MEHWRSVRDEDNDAVVRMFVAFNREDPGQKPVDAAHMRRTLAVLRAQPSWGRVVVLDVDGQCVGYALLIPFWSNELGGICCIIDEIYVAEAHRSRGHATALLTVLRAGSPLWPEDVVALCLEVSPKNERALALYRRLGFGGDNLTLRWRVRERVGDLDTSADVRRIDG